MWMFLGPEPLDHDDALLYCYSLGSDLVSIHGADEQAVAAELCDTVSHDYSTSYGCWIGLYHDDDLGKWRWTDGSVTDYGFTNFSNPTTGVEPWRGNEPNNNNEDCGHLYKEYLWNDIGCSNMPNYPICSTGTILVHVHLYSRSVNKDFKKFFN